MTITIGYGHFVIAAIAVAVGFLAGRETVWHNIRANLRRARFRCKIDGKCRNMRFNRMDSTIGDKEDEGEMLFVLDDCD